MHHKDIQACSWSSQTYAKPLGLTVATKLDIKNSLALRFARHYIWDIVAKFDVLVNVFYNSQDELESCFI